MPLCRFERHFFVRGFSSWSGTRSCRSERHFFVTGMFWRSGTKLCRWERRLVVRVAEPAPRDAEMPPAHATAARSPTSSPAAVDVRPTKEASAPPQRIPAVKMIVLGIDPGTAHTGYGVVARQGGRMMALDGGVVQTSPASDA